MEKNKHLYIGLDSDVLRSIAYILADNGETIDQKKEKSSLVSNNLNYLSQLIGCIKKGIIHPVICNTVYHEVKHIPYVVDFIKEYMYSPNINLTNYKSHGRKSYELAHKYCESYEEDGKTQYPPMSTTYIAEIDSYAPCNDSFVLAEYTVSGCMMTTFNGQDYVFIDNPKNRIRERGISIINRLNGYGDVPPPVWLYNLAPRFKELLKGKDPEEVWTSFVEQDDENFVKAELLL